MATYKPPTAPPKQATPTQGHPQGVTAQALVPTSGGEVSDAQLRAVVGTLHISAQVPAGATLAQVQESLSIVVQGYQRATSIQDQLRPIIGKLLWEVRERKLFAPAYKNFNQFLNGYIVGELGFGLTTAKNALRIATKFPTLGDQRYRLLGGTKLREAARLTSEGQEGVEEILQAAEGMNSTEFAQYVTDALKQLPSKRQRAKVVAVRATDDVYARWQAFVQAHPDTTQDALLAAAIDAYEAMQALPPARRPPVKRTA